MQIAAPTTRTPGTAPIKAEYIIAESRAAPDDDLAEGATKPGLGASAETGRPLDARDQGGPSRKKTKDEKKDRRGANKGRRFVKARDDLELCWRVACGSMCEFGDECRFTHDMAAYLAAKPKDIRSPTSSELSDVSPFVHPPPQPESTDAEGIIDTSTTCPVFQETGWCRHGLKCRFLGGHAQVGEGGALMLLRDEDKEAQTAVSAKEVNFVGPEILAQLRKHKYPHPLSNAYLKEMQAAIDDEQTKQAAPNTTTTPDEPATPLDVTMDVPQSESEASTLIEKRTGDASSSQAESPDVPVRFSEKKRLHWSGKTYLAPLTTVGNLPFRRICVDYGADITCGEMGLATSFLSGSKEEWSLVRRHPSESIFGVQLAGSKPATMVPTAEVIARECTGNVDFVDINCGCPIDLVFKSGSGSALLDSAGKLGKMIIGMNKVLGEIPVTVKLRTGVKDGRNTAHKLMPRLSSEFGVGCITLHGRTRQQRYTKLADWSYIKQCVDGVRAREADEDLPPVPIFGGGDCYSSEEYWSDVESTGVDGVMLARGALIKPWIFTEVKERREWDISARERLEHIRKYAEYGLSHFGTDTAGVNTTRRYLCEALSFQYRYVPIGLLEHLPGRLNDRPPAFRGRNDLETLLASDDSRDWVKISEMFLGPPPETWSFLPKHKSNAYESQG
ncbi:zinc finger dihydrouridine synthase [Athelia psychrophila]|uniref:tRNA-dihydrouridine(47) synthase [NAD(P)(+)] n=1 Tax=Athelia psychrophila TaxID=1759441 RepID=A0A167V339_9AGAM|nr:zinc finger dihydrouridine synthase [Fibularhizoctonia sp. CBS 109695]